MNLTVQCEHQCEGSVWYPDLEHGERCHSFETRFYEQWNRWYCDTHAEIHREALAERIVLMPRGNTESENTE